jgi:serine/threonine protein kinase
MNCPSHEILEQFVAGDLSIVSDRHLETHINQCGSCQVFLDHFVKKNHSPLFELNFDRNSHDVAQGQFMPVIPGFEMIELYRSGGQGLIYKAREKTIGRIVALKLMRDSQYLISSGDETLIREAQSVAKLEHANIVKLHSLVWSDHGPALILDWVDGGSLQDYLREKLPEEIEIIELMIQVAGALEHAHSQGILHRDIKPSNVLLRGGNLATPMLCDFGLAKEQTISGDYSSTTMGVGTAGFMAPEMISRKFGRVTVASDVYSMGALLYRMLTGVVPHHAETAFETLERTCDRNVTPPSFYQTNLSWDLETICLKCLERDPKARYGSISELKYDLEQFRDRGRIIADRPGWKKRLAGWSKEHPWIAVLSALLFSVLLISVITLTLLLQRARENQRNAETELARTIATFRLSTPLLKRFIQQSMLKPDEVKRISQIANLIKEMGVANDNLRHRFDLIYSGLEIAKELGKYPEHKSLAIEMTRNGQSAYRKLIEEHGDELDRMALLMVDGKIGISLLDQSMIRYGHSCMQLSEFLMSEPGMEEESLEMLETAIQTTQSVIKKNPEVDEAYEDLGNYYASQFYFYNQKNFAPAILLEIINKSIAMHDINIVKYPDDALKLNYWMDANLWKIILLSQDGNYDEFNNTIRIIKNRMVETMKKEELWKRTWIHFIVPLAMESKYFAIKADYINASKTLNSLIGTSEEMVKKSEYSIDSLKTLVFLQIENIALLKIQNRSQEAETYFNNLVKFWTRHESIEFSKVCLAMLYFYAPGKMIDNAKTSLEILNNVSNAEPEIEKYREICKGLINGVKISEDKQNLVKFIPPSLEFLNIFIELSKHNDIESINKYKAELNYLRKLRLYDIKNQLLISELLQTCDRFQLSK